MARLEYIKFQPWREGVDADGVMTMVEDPMERAISRLPQVFWSGGEGWDEANHFLLEKATTVGIKIKTVISLAKHLYSYARFLEDEELDWRHFPVRLSNRAVVRFRGHLMEQINRGSLPLSQLADHCRTTYVHWADGHEPRAGAPVKASPLLVLESFGWLPGQGVQAAQRGRGTVRNL